MSGDWDRSGHQITMQGDAYSGDKGQPAPGTITINGISRLNPIAISGLNLITRWGHRLENGSRLNLQAYYDSVEMWATWQASANWRLNGGFTALRCVAEFRVPSLTGSSFSTFRLVRPAYAFALHTGSGGVP